MKRIFIFMALAAMVLSVNAAKKPKKTDATTAATSQVAAPASSATLKTSSDTISYAAGYAQAAGVAEFMQQLNIDKAYLPDLIEGLKEARAKSDDPAYAARHAGMQINQIIKDRMLPGIGGELKGTPDSLNADMFYTGFFASLAGDTTNFKGKEAENLFMQRMQANHQKKEDAAKAVKAAGEAWLAENKTKPGVVTTASGLQYKVITMGTGERPKADQEVEVKYEGHLIDGTEFDSSYKRNPQTTKFKCNQVIKGWTEGLQLMPVGSKFEFYIPQELGYGARAAGQNIPPYSALIFTVELISVK